MAKKTGDVILPSDKAVENISRAMQGVVDSGTMKAIASISSNLPQIPESILKSMETMSKVTEQYNMINRMANISGAIPQRAEGVSSASTGVGMVTGNDVGGGVGSKNRPLLTFDEIEEDIQKKVPEYELESMRSKTGKQRLNLIDQDTVSGYPGVSSLVPTLPQTPADFVELYKQSLMAEADYSSFYERQRDRDDYSTGEVAFLVEFGDRIKKQREYFEQFRSLYSTADQDIMRSNFDYMLEINDILENELEMIFGKGKKYYARAFNKDDPLRRLSVDSLLEMCNLFHVSLDRFMKEDMRKKTLPALEKAIKFIDRLIEMITSLKMKWEKAKIYDGTEMPEYMKDDFGQDELALNEFSEFVYGCIKNRQDKDRIYIESWFTPITDGFARLFVFFVDGMPYRYRFVNDISYYGGEDKHILFDSDEDGTGTILKKCHELYSVIKEYEKVFFLDKGAEHIMDHFFSGLDDAEGGESE